jgi:hypothetical protein
MLAIKSSAVNETTPTHKARARKSRRPRNSPGKASRLSAILAAAFCVGVTFRGPLREVA